MEDPLTFNARLAHFRQALYEKDPVLILFLLENARGTPRGEVLDFLFDFLRVTSDTALLEGILSHMMENPTWRCTGARLTEEEALSVLALLEDLPCSKDEAFFVFLSQHILSDETLRGMTGLEGGSLETGSWFMKRVREWFLNRKHNRKTKSS